MVITRNLSISSLIVNVLKINELSNFFVLLCYRFKLRMNGIQVDNQLPLTLMPVLFRPQRVGEETEYILKFSVTLQTNESLDLCVYPYIGFHVSFSISLSHIMMIMIKSYIQF